MTREETIKILAMFAEIYDQKNTPSDGFINIWRNSLKNVPYGVGVAAFQEVVESCRFMPSLAEYKEIIKDIQTDIENPIIDVFGTIADTHYKNPAVSEYIYKQQAKEQMIDYNRTAQLGTGEEK